MSLFVHLVVVTVLDDELVTLVLVESPNRLLLPGGPVQDDDDLLSAADRELWDLTGLESSQVHLEQLATYGHHRRVTVAYLAVVRAQAAEDITETELAAGTTDGFAGGPTDDAPDGVPDVTDAEWLPAGELLDTPAALAFDHHAILADGIERVRAKLEYSPLATAFCPPEFTIGDLRRVYQAVWDTDLDPRNFHRKVSGTADFLVETGRSTHGEAGRPARLYRRGDVDRLHPAILRPS